MPSTFTTLPRAAAAPRVAALPRDGGATSAAGPRTDGIGSIRASACRNGPDGGSSWLSSWRIAERWMSSRSTGDPADWSATAPTIQAIPSATEAVRTAPNTPSTKRSPGTRRNMRARAPSPCRPLASTAPASSAPDQAEQRRILGVRAGGQHERGEVGAEECSQAETEQRQGAYDEPLRVAVERQQHGEGHDQPVDFRHR